MCQFPCGALHKPFLGLQGTLPGNKESTLTLKPQRKVKGDLITKAAFLLSSHLNMMSLEIIFFFLRGLLKHDKLKKKVTIAMNGGSCYFKGQEDREIVRVFPTWKLQVVDISCLLLVKFRIP